MPRRRARGTMRFRPPPTEAPFAREAGHIPTQPIVPGLAISLAVALPCIRARQIDQCGDLDMTNLRLVL